MRSERCGGLLSWWIVVAAAMLAAGAGQRATAQENPLNAVHTPVPTPATAKPAGPVIEGADVAKTGAAAVAAGKAPKLRVDVNLVLVPVSVTDARNRLVTGLERENFQVFDNNAPQEIRSFTLQDAPVSIGIVFDLSGSMDSKYTRARKALSEFLHTSNPLDEFFVIGFNDRPAVVVDYTSDPEDIEARMVMLKPEKRTALIDAIYLGVSKLKEAKYDRRALLVVSDGGDNRSRYTQSELRREVRENDLQIYSIGIFDRYAPTEEERSGPELLNDVCEMTGGQMFRVRDVDELSDIAAKISSELRNEYLLGFRPSEVKKDGNFRKLRMKLTSLPPGLPVLNLHYKEGYYAPAQ